MGNNYSVDKQQTCEIIQNAQVYFKKIANAKTNLLPNYIYDNSFIKIMLVQKLFSTQKKQYTTKPLYKKPVYKSYKELLQLDRPRKKIEYSSQSQDEDFLEKLLNAQNQKAKQKKKRKKSLNSAKKRPSQQKMRLQVNASKQDNKGNIANPQKKISRGASAQKKHYNQLSLIQQQKHENAKEVEIHQKIENKIRVKTVEKPSLQNEIYIDNKSIESLPMLYSSTNHLFQTSMTERKNSAYAQLLKQKGRYLEQFKPKQSLFTVFNNEKKIQHHLNHTLETKFSFKPNIEPVNPNWRFNLTIGPKVFLPEREFVDRKTLFRNKEQQERFVKSLREISKKKK